MNVVSGARLFKHNGAISNFTAIFTHTNTHTHTHKTLMHRVNTLPNKLLTFADYLVSLV